MSDTKTTILFEVKDKIATVTLNRPDKLNAMNSVMRSELLSVFRAVNDDPSVNIVIIKGNGRAFSAGADQGGGADKGERSVQDWRINFSNTTGLYRYMLSMDKLVLAQTHGYVLGAGFALMNACDMTISTDTCRFGVPELRQSGSVAMMLMPANISRNKAFELFTGDFIDGKAAESIGLINKAVPENQIETEVAKFAKKISLMDPIGIKMNKQEVNSWYRVSEMDSTLAHLVDSAAVLYASEGHRYWAKLRSERDLKEYLKLRDGPFKEIG